jgi:hypothetical protein
MFGHFNRLVCQWIGQASGTISDVESAEAEASLNQRASGCYRSGGEVS